MKKQVLKIDNEIFGSLFNLEQIIDSFSVSSILFPYEVRFENNIFKYIENSLNVNEFSYVFFIDENILSIYKDDLKFIKNHTLKSFKAVEENKNVEAAFELCDLLVDCNANRKTIIYVIGGGIMQDIGFKLQHFKEVKYPWIYVPTNTNRQKR